MSVVLAKMYASGYYTFSHKEEPKVETIKEELKLDLSSDEQMRSYMMGMI